MVVANAGLAGGRPPGLCRSGRRGAAVDIGLSGRCAMERGRRHEELVRADQVPPVVPADPERHPSRGTAVADLRRSRLLNDPATLKQELGETARRHGFDALRVVAPNAIPQAGDRFAAFLRDGAHGDMDWLARDPQRRADPRALWPEVRSVIMLGLNYGPDGDPLEVLKTPDRGAVSVYAQGEDYHEIIKPRLKAIARWLTATAGGDVKVFVDTAAVMEKPLAAAAGLGWQGGHANLVSRELGSWFFLGAIVTALVLPSAA